MEAARSLEAALAQDEALHWALDAVLTKLDVVAEAERAQVMALGERSFAVGGDFRGVLVAGDHNQITVQDPNAPDPDALRREYLEELSKGANRLPWIHVDRDQADALGGGAGVELNDIYVPLDTAELERVEDEAQLRESLKRLERGEVRRVPLQTVANEAKRLLILGDPDSGKSTFVKHLAYTMAQAELARLDGDEARASAWLVKLDPWAHGVLLPLLIELREAEPIVAQHKGKAGASLFLTVIQGGLEDVHLGEFWPDLKAAIRAEETQLLFLLDGLDEVSESLRGRVVEMVRNFANRYSQHRYVVTCRPYAYLDKTYRLSGFREVTVAPFDKAQVDRFIETWYKRLARTRIAQEDAEEKMRDLKQAVRQRDLWGIARRPLLLTVMALLHTFRGRLPKDRTELYADAVELLLRRWEQRLGGDEGLLERLDIPGLKRSDLEAGLYEVAFRVHAGSAGKEETTDIAEGDLRRWLAPYLGESWDKAGVFVAYVRERAGLLIARKPGVYAFPHRTFQEFLAACYLVGQHDYPAESARRVLATPDHWREVFKMAAGYAARTHRLSQAIASVNKLCPEGVGEADGIDAQALRRAMLAAESLEEIGLVGVQREPDGRALLKRVRGWLIEAMRADGLEGRPSLPATERAAAGRLLARLGDPRFDPDRWYLPKDPLLGFVPIPEGEFLMGSTDEDEMARNSEKPQRTVWLPLYYIARYPVTQAQYRAFVEAGGYDDRRWWTEAGWTWVQKKQRRGPGAYGFSFGLDNHPVVGISWYEAVAYTRWLRERLREEAVRQLAAGVEDEEARAFWQGLKEGRLVVALPSEAEWEKAARGVDGRRYPWGEEPNPNRANYADTRIGTTSAVGCFPGGASPYGVEETSGNVWEWCRTKWEDDYVDYWGADDLEGEARRVLRGGAFNDAQRNARCASRFRLLPFDSLDWDLGFRVGLLPFSH